MIVDTNAVSAFLDGEPEVVARCLEAEALSIPMIVLGEYRYGLRRSRLRKVREPQLTEFVASCSVLPVSESTTTFYASIRQQVRETGEPIPGNDIWIAAIAIEHRLPILSNDGHFDSVRGVTRIPWGSEG